MKSLTKQFTTSIFKTFGIFLILTPLLSQALPLNLSPTGNKDNLSYEIENNKKIDTLFYIQNISAQPVKIKIYPTDAIESNTSALAYKLESEEQNGVGKMITFYNKQTSLTTELKPSSITEIPFQIQPEKNASPGDYIGALAVEMITDNSENKDIKIKSRIVKPIYLKIPGEKITKYSIDEISFNKESKTFLINIKNEGNTILNLSGIIKIQNKLLNKKSFNDDKNKYELKIPETTIPQNSSQKIEIPYSDLPCIGTFFSESTLTIKQFNFTKNKFELIENTKKTLTFNVIPWLFIFMTFLVIFLLTFLFIYYRIKNEKKQKQLKIYISDSKDTITSIAKKHNCNWKDLAKLNKLKAPYIIKKGTKIKLPK